MAAEAFGLSGAGPWPITEGRRAVIAVISWDDLLTTLGRGESERYRHELEQFSAMYQVLSGDHIAPLASLEDLRHWRERATDFVSLVDRATRRLTTAHRLYPIGVDPLEQELEGLEPRGYTRRYVCYPNGPSTSCLSIGVRDSFAEWVTPIWLRFHRDTPQFAHIVDRIRSSTLRWVDSGGHVWLPLDVPLAASGEQMVDSLVTQAA